jgi:hypothetical protein
LGKRRMAGSTKFRKFLLAPVFLEKYGVGLS